MADTELRGQVAELLDIQSFLTAGLRNKRRKKAGRLNTHIMDDFVEMDDSQDGAETPVGMRPGAGRRPTAMLRPLSGTSDRQCACPLEWPA